MLFTFTPDHPYDFAGPVQNTRSFRSKSAVVVYPNDKILFPAEAVARSLIMQNTDNKDCQNPSQKFTIKLTSKKLFPPDATPLTLFTVVEVSQ